MLDRIKIDQMIYICRTAGITILDIYEQDIEVEVKNDFSPLTQADRKSNQIILDFLKKNYPDIPFISEETKQTPYEERKNWEYFWLIDPLDGTKEFIKKNGEFTINVALVHRNTPVFGIVYIPVKNTGYFAFKGQGSYKFTNENKTVKISAKPLPQSGKLVIMGSRSHGGAELEKFVEEKRKKYDVEFISAGSALKICLVAEGLADMYPRTGPTMEWDTAAGQIIAEESGKKVLVFNSENPLLYNKENLLNPMFIVT